MEKDSRVGERGDLSNEDSVRSDELSKELAVLYRVFRHDFRNRLNVILGQAEVAKTKTDDETLERFLETVLDEVQTLSETVDQVTFIQNLASSGSSPDAVDIAPTLRRLVAEYDEQTTATFESSIPGSVWVWMNPSYEAAFRELIENAVVHNDAADPCVTVQVEQEETTKVRITDNGPGMPQGTKASLESTDVDSTDHLTSLGLWTAYWIITRSGGRFDIEDSYTRGCQISIVLRAASPAA